LAALEAPFSGATPTARTRDSDGFMVPTRVRRIMQAPHESSSPSDHRFGWRLADKASNGLVTVLGDFDGLGLGAQRQIDGQEGVPLRHRFLRAMKAVED
jgi:hypothetical protein